MCIYINCISKVHILIVPSFRLLYISVSTFISFQNWDFGGVKVEYILGVLIQIFLFFSKRFVPVLTLASRDWSYDCLLKLSCIHMPTYIVGLWIYLYLMYKIIYIIFI